MTDHRWGWLAALLIVLTASGPTPPPQEAECWAEFVAYRDGPWSTRYDGPEAVRSLLSRLEAIMARYEQTAPRCGGRLLEYQTFLLHREGRYVEIEQRLAAYLTGPGRTSDVSLRLRLLARRGYALEQLGEIRESSQQYFAAAALAGVAEAESGVEALLNAVVSADILQDVAAQERYLDEASRLIADSLRGREVYDGYLAQVSMGHADILEDRIQETVDMADRRWLASQLLDVSEQALELLPETGLENTGFRARMTGANALALAILGETERARLVSAPMLDLARQARSSLPSVVYDVWLYQSLIAEAADNLDAARQHALEAKREATILGNGVRERSMLRRLAHLSEREEDWSSAALAYENAIKEEEEYRGRLGLQDWTAQAFAGVDEAYRGLVRSRLAMDDNEAAFLTLDQTRGRYLRDLRRHLDVRTRMTPDDRALAERIQTEIDSARLALTKGEIRGADRATATVRVSELQEELEVLTGSSVAPPPDFEIRELQAALEPRDQTLISYFLDARRSVAFVVRPDTFATVDLGTTPAAIDEILEGVGAPWRGGDHTEPAFSLGALHDLYGAILEPLMPWVTGTSSIVVVPDRPLGGVPFGMLVTEPAEDYASAKYLVRTVAVTTELAASMIPEAAAMSPQDEIPLDLLAFGRSDFAGTGFTWNSEAGLTDLPHVDAEVRQIGKGVRMREVALNREATETELMRRLSDARVIHLASHAESDPEFPLYSKIALWDGEGDDGVLYLYELQSRALAADLVVLSGCSTARGRHQDGEGMIGLQYAVRSAGARASLATLWPVDDRASVELMRLFYDGLKDGLTKDRALQRAQVAYLDSHDGLSASPFYWAAPVLSGDTAPVPLRVTATPPKWLALGLCVAGLALAWRLRRRRLDA